MFVFEVWMTNGSVFSGMSFETLYDAEVAMYDFIDLLEDDGVDFVIVKEDDE